MVEMLASCPNYVPSMRKIIYYKLRSKLE